MKKFRYIVASLVLCSIQICAADKYVASTGNDSNDGTLASPYLTLNKAYANIGDSGTIYVMDDIILTAQTVFNADRTVTVTSCDAAGNPATSVAEAHQLMRPTNWSDSIWMNISMGTVDFTNIILDGQSTKRATRAAFVFQGSSVVNFRSGFVFRNFYKTGNLSSNNDAGRKGLISGYNNAVLNMYDGAEIVNNGHPTDPKEAGIIVLIALGVNDTNTFNLFGGKIHGNRTCGTEATV